MSETTAVFIGRFQPFHNGHLHAILRAFDYADHVHVIIGEVKGPRSPKNPFPPLERYRMIRATMQELHPELLARMYIDVLEDIPSDAEWVGEVEKLVNKFSPNNFICIIGHEKDASSFYLKKFPSWKFIDTGYDRLTEDPTSDDYAIDATYIRGLLYENKLPYVKGMVPAPVLRILDRIVHESDYFAEIVEEYKFNKNYREMWKVAPFPPTFVTCDAMVVSGPNILMVKRGQRPGKGLLALPGGFINQTETLESCAIRELLEETNIKLQEDTLRRCITKVKVFDRANQSPNEGRGRIFTHVHLIQLDDSKPAPKVKGGDDAAEALWVNLSELNPAEVFSDHYSIIESMSRFLK